METIVKLITFIVILSIGAYLIVQMKEYNDTCYMKFEGKTYYLCTE